MTSAPTHPIINKNKRNAKIFSSYKGVIFRTLKGVIFIKYDACELIADPIPLISTTSGFVSPPDDLFDAGLSDTFQKIKIEIARTANVEQTIVNKVVKLSSSSLITVEFKSSLAQPVELLIILELFANGISNTPKK